MLTCGVAGLCTKRQDFDILVIGACSQQLPTLTPGNTVDGTFVMFVPLEAHHWLLDWTGPTEERWMQMYLCRLSAGFKFFTCRDAVCVSGGLVLHLGSIVSG